MSRTLLIAVVAPWYDSEVSAGRPGGNPPAKPADQSNTWALSMDIIDPAAPSAIDLRALNEKVAGRAGFVQRSKDGNGFVHGDGTPLRFWGASLNIDLETAGDEEVARRARFSARMGVNLLRVGGK